MSRAKYEKEVIEESKKRMQMSANQFKDLFNNMLMPDIADRMTVELSDGARIIKQYDEFAESYGKSFTQSETANDCRKVMMELALNSLNLVGEKAFTYKQLQDIARLSRSEVVDVMSYLRYGR